MDFLHQKRMQKLLKKMEIIDINDYSSLERLNNYVKKTAKNIHVCRHPGGKAHNYHTHDFFEINYLYEGDCVNVIDGESIYMESGDFVMMHPGVFHTIYAEKESKVVNILVRKSFFYETFSAVEEGEESLVSKFIGSIRDKSYYKYIVCNGECVREEIEKLMEEEYIRGFNCDIMQSALFCKLICKLLRTDSKITLSGKQNPSSDIVMEIFEYMHENYKDATLKAIAEKFGYSDSHLCRMFLKETGKSIGRVLTETRMNKAMEYLGDTDLKMYEISGLIGYDSHEYFQRVFKKYFGMTPLQCRQRRDEGAQEVQEL